MYASYYIFNIRIILSVLPCLHAKKYANKVGMMHESKGQQIGKSPFLHITDRQHA